MDGWRRHARGFFVALYLVVQIGVPLAGLYASHRAGDISRFSWHMFSRVPAATDE